MIDELQLDHVVINVRDDMDYAEGVFSELGFNITPRGYHTLGSINHLMIFGSDYLELIGFPVGGVVTGKNTRADLTTAPVGINGLVFKCANVDKTYKKLCELNMDGDPPKAFSRPVELDGKIQDAKFRTVSVRSDVFPEGRVYFCEHGTPELVWRDDWQVHENKIRAVSEVVIIAKEAASTADNYGRLVNAAAIEKADGTLTVNTGDVRLTVCSLDQYDLRYGSLGSKLGDRSALFGALVFQTEDQIANFPYENLNTGDFLAERHPDRLVVRLPRYDSVLEFVGLNV